MNGSDVAQRSSLLWSKKLDLLNKGCPKSHFTLGKLRFLRRISTKWPNFFTDDKWVLIVYSHKKNVEQYCFGVQSVSRITLYVKDLLFHTHICHWFNQNITATSFKQMFNVFSIHFQAFFPPAYSFIQHILKVCLWYVLSSDRNSVIIFTKKRIVRWHHDRKWHTKNVVLDYFVRIHGFSLNFIRPKSRSYDG